MAIKKAKSSKVAAKKPARKTAKKKSIDISDPRQVRQAAVDAVLGRTQEFIEKVINAAANGNYAPAKFLLEFAGIAEPLPDPNDEAAARRKSLAEILLQAVNDPVTNVSGGAAEQPDRG